MVELRDFLMGLVARNRRPLNDDTLRDLQGVEDMVGDLLYPRWEECQNALGYASEADLAEVDTTWMGLPFPDQFRNATVDTLKGYLNSHKPLRTAQNPATLLETGAL